MNHNGVCMYVEQPRLLNIARSQKAALSTSRRLSSVSSCSYQMTFVRNGFKCEFVLLNFDTIIVFELSQLSFCV